MATVASGAALQLYYQNPIKTLQFPLPLPISKPIFNSTPNSSLSLHALKSTHVTAARGCNNTRFSCCSASTATTSTNYEFSDSSADIELRLSLVGQDIQSSRDVFVDADGTSLTVRVQRAGSPITLIETNHLFENIKPAETIWYIDDDQLVINMKKQDPDLKWPDIVESWESLTAGSMRLLRGTSVYIVGDSTEINQKVARELAVGLGYTPLDTQELLESFSKQALDSWMLAEDSEAVAAAESTILESLSSHVRVVVSTLGGKHGADSRGDKWRHLYAGFTVWVSQTEAIDEDSAKEEARKHVQDGSLAYSKADVVVKLQGWDSDHAKSVAQASLSAPRCGVLTVEIEHVDVATLEKLEQLRVDCQPKASTIRIIQIDDLDGSKRAADLFGYALMIKSRRLAYDGRGNAVAKSEDELPAAVTALGGFDRGLYVEKWTPFVKELAVIVARGRDGSILCYP